MSITAPACASCVFGATSTALLSFTYQAIETVTVKVVPHITVYTQGSSTSSTTNYVSITETDTNYVGGGSNRNASKTFDHTDQLTWTVGDATLTYPTTYVQYLGFAGAAVPSDDGDKCAAGSDATGLQLQSSTDASAFIYPYTNTGATSLPEPLLSYLQAPFAAQFSGQALTACAGLNYIPAETTSGVAYASFSDSGLSSISTSIISFGNYTRTHTRVIRPGGPQTLTVGRPEPSSDVPRASSVAGPPSFESTQSHSTAFVIQPVTAQYPIVTTLPGGSNNHHTTVNPDVPEHATTKPHNGQPPTYRHSPGGDNTATQTPAHQPQRDHTSKGHNNHVTPAGHHERPTRSRNVFTLGSSHITAKPHGPVTIGHHTLHHGETITLGHGPSATTVALQGHRGHDRLVVNGKTQRGQHEFAPVTKSHADVSSAVITTNGHKITVLHSSGSVVYKDGSSKTTVAAGSKVTFEGHTFEVPSHDGSVKVDGTKVALIPVPSSQAIIIAGGHTFTAEDSGSSIILKDGSKTITIKDGAKTTFDGSVISVKPSGSAVVVDGKTATLSAAPTPEAVITTGPHTITALDIFGTIALVDGHSTTTVKGGRTVTFEGQTFVVPTHGTAVVVNGRTVEFTTSTSASTTGVGRYVNSGLGGGSTPSATSTVQLADTNAAASAGLPMVGALWSALLAALSLLLAL